MKWLVKIIQFTRALWPYYLGVSTLSMAVALLAQAQPLLIGAIVSEFLQLGSAEFSSNNIWWFVALLLLQDLANNLITNVQGYWGDILSAKLQKTLSNRYYSHLLSLPQSYFDTELTGKITARLNRSISQISSFSQMMANNFGAFILTTVFSLIIVAFLSWPIALLLFSLYPIFIALTIRSSGKWMHYQEQKNQLQDQAYGRFQEVVSQVKVVKSFTNERSELAFFKKLLGKRVALEYPQSKHWHKRDVARKLVLNIIFGVVYAVLIWQVTTGQISLASFVMLIQFAALIRFPIFTISFLVENIQRAVADSKDYFEIMELAPETSLQLPHAKALKAIDGAIVFDNVSFSYDTQPVLSNISFTIPAGTSVALVGESGAGKTTITNLLLKLYNPSQGRVMIDGQALQDHSLTSIRRAVGVVFQDPSLFSGTVKDNISFGSNASQGAIEAVARSANAHEFIVQFPDGYNTIIGERGLKLSGGQKQRLAIARALLKDAPILLLDEATSSLDSKSELLVQEALHRLMRGRTTLIIAHRLSTIQEVDQIITLRNGSVDEVGSPRELADSGGIYARLLELQQATGASRLKLLRKYDIVQ